jgi:hypothetical protein
MPHPPRRALPAMLIALAGCVAAPPAPPVPAVRHAALVAAADLAAGQVVDHLARRERIELEQAAMLRFGTGGVPPRLPAPVVPVAGMVLDPGMELVLLEAQRLAVLAARPEPAPPPEGQEGAAMLARLEAGLAALAGAPGRWPAGAVRRRGLDGFRLLAQPAPAGSTAAAHAAARGQALADAVALLRAVVGEGPREGLRGVLAERHAAWRAAQQALLDAARTDRTVSPAERMALWRATQARLAADPPDVAAAELVRLFAALPAAHAAAGAGDAAGVEAFAAAVARAQALAAEAR